LIHVGFHGTSILNITEKTFMCDFVLFMIMYDFMYDFAEIVCAYYFLFTLHSGNCDIYWHNI
jgi:hypothetical protein